MRFKQATAATVCAKGEQTNSIIPVPKDKPITIGRGREADWLTVVGIERQVES